MTSSSQRPIKIGITGTICAGKSTIGQILQDNGVAILDTDHVVAELYQPGSTLVRWIEQAFGQSVVDETGAINRKALRDIVFSDAERLKTLESLVHPVVREKTVAFLNDPTRPEMLRAVLVPLLFETQTENLYDEVWTIKVDMPALLERLIQREKITEEEAHKRLNLQWSQDKKAQRSHRIIDNTGSVDATRKQIEDALQAIQQKVYR